MRVPWTARRSNQPILKEIHPEISLEGLMLKVKLQYFGHLMRRVNSLEKTLMLGGIGGRRRRARQRMRWLDGITDSMDMTIPMEKKCKKAKWLSGEALQIAVKRREVKTKGEKERYKHLNAEFQRIARTDKNAFFSNQCKEIGREHFMQRWAR